MSLANGVAALTTSSLTVGGHAVTAAYTSDGNLFKPSNGVLVGGQTVNKADVTVGLAVDHAIAVVGETVTFTATVAAVTNGLPEPTGTVTFSEGSTILGSVPLNGGQASFPTSVLAVGDDSITANYSDDSDFAANSSAAFAETVNPVLAATSIAAVSPNPRNAPVSSIDVTFNEPVDLATFTTASLTLTDSGGANLITNGVTFAAVSGTTSTYAINGLASLTAAEGHFTLTVNSAGFQDQSGNASAGSLSTTWLMDTTPPTSTVNPLPSATNSSFTVSVTGSDPTGSNGSTPSGIKSFTIYVSEDNGPFAALATVTPANPSTPFTGQIGHTYGFYSVATDNAGNVQPTPTQAQATVQIVSGLTITSITPVTPNPRNTAVATVDVTFSESIDVSSLDSSDITLTQNGTDVPVSSLTFTPISGTTFQVGGLAAFDVTDGVYVWSVNAGGIKDTNESAGSGSLSTSWLMDTTPPVSTVSSLPTPTTSTTFNVSVGGSDPNGPDNSPASGVASFDIFTDTDGGSFSLWMTVTPASPKGAIHRSGRPHLRLLQCGDRQCR